MTPFNFSISHLKIRQIRSAGTSGCFVISPHQCQSLFLLLTPGPSAVPLSSAPHLLGVSFPLPIPMLTTHGFLIQSTLKWHQGALIHNNSMSTRDIGVKRTTGENRVMWTPGYTSTDRLTSWGVLYHQWWAPLLKKLTIISLLVTGLWKKVTIISLLVTGLRKKVTIISLLVIGIWKKVTIISLLVTGVWKKVMIISLLVTGIWKKVTILSLLVTFPTENATIYS